MESIPESYVILFFIYYSVMCFCEWPYMERERNYQYFAHTEIFKMINIFLNSDIHYEDFIFTVQKMIFIRNRLELQVYFAIF